MNAILYIARRQIVNSVRRFLRRPARVAAGLVSLALIAWMLFGLPEKSGGTLDPRILHGGFLVWLLLLGTVTAFSSVGSGTQLFSLPDANLLFVSPLSPKKILAYGLVRQTGKTLAGFLFLLFYSGMLIDSFGISPYGVLLLALGTALFLVIVQVAALGLYCFAEGNPARRRGVRAGLLAVPALCALLAYLLFRNGGGTMEALYAAAASPLLEAVPVAGWAKGAVFALMAGNGRAALLYGSLLAAFLALAATLLLKTDADYYENAMRNAETAFELRRSVQEKGAAGPRGKRHGKVGKTGIGRGWGADAFFFKHLREARRGGRFAFLGSSAVLLLLVSLGVAGILTLIGRNRGTPVPPDLMLVAACVAGTYILFFSSFSGDWSRELARPYLYLVPENPFKKLLWAGMTTALRPVFDGTVAFSVTCALLGANPFTALACILVYAGFGLLFTAGSVLGRRVLGSAPNRGMVMMLYMLLLLAVMAPGVAGSFLTAAALGGAPAGAAPLLIALPCAGWNLLVSLGILYACRGLLSSAEL